MDKKEYLGFLKKLFSLGLQEEIEDQVLLSLMTQKRKREAELFAEYLIQKPTSLDEISAFSWEEIQRKIQGADETETGEGTSFFAEYCNLRANAKS